MTSMTACLLRHAKELKDFDKESVVEAAAEYKKRGEDDHAANIKAVEDHLDGLREERNRVVFEVMNQFKASHPKRYAEMAKDKSLADAPRAQTVTAPSKGEASKEYPETSSAPVQTEAQPGAPMSATEADAVGVQYKIGDPSHANGVMVAEAIRDGKEVPDKVLSEYPGLKVNKVDSNTIGMESRRGISGSEIESIRERFVWRGSGTNEIGPVFRGDGFALEAVQKVEFGPDVTDFPRRGEWLLGHARAVENPGGLYWFQIRNATSGSANGQYMGQMLAEINEFGEIAAIHDIEVEQGLRGRYIGHEVVATISANAPDGVRIVEALEQAKGFWNILGANDEYDTYQDGNITWNSTVRAVFGRQGRDSRHHQEVGDRVQQASPEAVRFHTKFRSTKELDKAEESRFSVSAGKTLKSRAVQGVADKFRRGFKGAEALDVRVVDSRNDITRAFRPSPYAEGVFHDSAGRIYLIAENLPSVRRAWQVLLHEAVGHYSVSHMMGPEFKPILKRVYSEARAKGDSVIDVKPGDADYATVEAVTMAYPFKEFSSELQARNPGRAYTREELRELHRDTVAQEVLARMAETSPNRLLLGYAKMKIREWANAVLRALGVSYQFQANELNDLIVKAAAYLRSGGNMGREVVPGGMVAASKSASMQPMSSKGAGAPSADKSPSPADAYTQNNEGVGIPAPEIPRRVSQKWFEGLLQAIDNEFLSGDDPYFVQEFRPIFKKLKDAGIDSIDFYHVTDASLVDFDSEIRGSSVSLSGRDGFQARDTAVYGFLDPYDIKRGYAGILGAEKERPNVAHIRVPVSKLFDFQWDGNYNVTFGTYSGVSLKGAIPRDWIVGFYENYDINKRKAESNAIHPNESFAPDNTGVIDVNVPLESRAVIIGDSGRKYTPEQQRAFSSTGRTIQKLSPQERLVAVFQGAGKKMAQGIVDQFAPVKDIDAKAYTLLRLSKGATGAFEALMHHGKLSLRDGAYDADTTGGVLEKVFYPLGKESSDFLYWIAGNRAEKLMKEGREHLFSPEDIAAYKDLSKGVTDFDYLLSTGKTTRDRTLIYRDSLSKFNEFNKNVLDIAEQSGLIDGASRSVWESEFYVPFYRVADDQDGGVRGMNVKQGVVRQEAFKKLKGGTEGLNDLMANTLMNWAHLIDASAKNRAAKATLEAATKAGAARKATQGEKKTVWFVDGGKKVEYKVEDPYLLTALNGLEYAGLRGPAMQAMSAFKHWLTIGVTASPFFKVRNLIRDSMQAIATSDLNANPLTNVAEGFRLTDRERQEYVSALAGGGLIRFGTMLEGNEASRTRQLIKKGAKDATILDSESKVRAFYDKYIEPAISAYNELGNRGEEINRMALYDQLIKSGHDHATASLMARDLMDFSMQGAWTTIRFLTQVVPFMNARLQGMYKLGRSAKQDPARFAAVIGATTIASLALLSAYSDDDDWRRREDWDRDNYWWFKYGGMAFRIPKPFEVGAIATLAERSAEYMFDNEMTGNRFKERVTQLLSDQLNMNPVPQLVKPIIDIYANKDSFTGRPIESMGMERLEPEYRFRQGTSMAARGISTSGNAITGGRFLSPVQVDHLIRGYFSWLGAVVVGGADIAVRSASNEPTKPAVDYWKTATGGMAAELDGAPSRYLSQMYDQAVELEQAYSTWRELMKHGKREDAEEYRRGHLGELGRYRSVEGVKRSISKLNERIRNIERSDGSSEEKRAKINRIRNEQDRIARRLVVDGR